MPEYDWITDEIFTVSEFFTPQECAAAIQRAEEAAFAEAPINSAFGAEYQPEIRNNSRVILDDPALAEQLWERSIVYLPLKVGDWLAAGFNERLRYYRYDVGQQFDWHYDGAFERPTGERSRLTFMIYLNEDFDGGQTSFENAVITPRTGMALFFVHRQLHKGEPVQRGRKYVLRSDVMYRRAGPIASH